MKAENENFFLAINMFMKLKKSKEDFDNEYKRLAFKTLLISRAKRFNFKKK